MKRIFFCLFILLLPATTSLSALAETTDAMLAWGERDLNGIYNIHFSRRNDGIWREPVRISASAYPEILPAIGSDSQGKIWLAWIELHGINGSIVWSYFSGDNWSAPAYLDTPTDSEPAVSIAVDSADQAWMAFSGTREGVDDIFVSRWAGKEWGGPVSISRKDKWPDILPVLTIAPDGKPIVFWQGYNGEQYVQYRSHWDGTGWSDEEELGIVGKQEVREKSSDAGQVKEWLKELPPFIQDRSQAVFHSTLGRRKTVNLRTR